jgi:drug/metabolite transporter (DMT)-like permease
MSRTPQAEDPKISPARLIALTALTMLAFAGNSLLCRMALEHTGIDPATFTTIRVISGALTLWVLVQLRRGHRTGSRGNWTSALALFVYAAGFSFAYVSLTAASGALMLFVAVQATMISHGLWMGERFRHLQIAGLVLALGGLVGLLLPGLSAPPLGGSILMLAAGAAWGVYSLRGKGSGDPLAATAGNLLRAVPVALVLSVLAHRQFNFDSSGFWYAVSSGAIASGVGYAIWYTVLPFLKATEAATVQLSVPVIAAVGGIILLDEPMNLRLVIASVAILGGIALVIRKPGAPSAAKRVPAGNSPRR